MECFLLVEPASRGIAPQQKKDLCIKNILILNSPETTINHGLVGDEITYLRKFGTIYQNRG